MDVSKCSNVSKWSYVSKGCLQKKNPYGGTLGGEGVQKNFKMSLPKIPFYYGTFFKGGRGSNHYLICLF